MQGTFSLPQQALQVTPEADAMQFRGVALTYDAIGEYLLPRPVFFSPETPERIWEELGVHAQPIGPQERMRYVVAPQPASAYRPHSRYDDASLLDMQGRPLEAGQNPGVRVEPDFVSEEEEAELVAELSKMAGSHGYDFAAEDADGAASESWRITGREEKMSKLPLAPWGWGTRFDKGKVPRALAEVVSKIEALAGYPLGPIRDITVNMRSSVDFQMSPHIDPPGDGPNSFVLSLMSGAVVTFSPVRALRAEPARASDEEEFIRHSFTDEDIDCLVPQRAMYHFSGNARYLWTHAIRPPATHVGKDGLEAYERWGTWDKVLRRRKDRVSIIFTFADPPRSQP